MGFAQKSKIDAVSIALCLISLSGIKPPPRLCVLERSGRETIKPQTHTDSHGQEQSAWPTAKKGKEYLHQLKINWALVFQPKATLFVQLSV